MNINIKFIIDDSEMPEGWQEKYKNAKCDIYRIDKTRQSSEEEAIFGLFLCFLGCFLSGLYMLIISTFSEYY